MSSSTHTATIDRGSANPVPPWLWLNLLSIDAPIVALLWQALFNQVFGADLRWPAFVALGTTVWIIYVCDRLLDTRNVPSHAHSVNGLSTRHPFYLRHRTAFKRALIVGTMLLLATIPFLNPAVLRNGMITAGMVGSYLVVVHAKFTVLRRYFPKELVVGLIFAIGTCLATWTKVHGSQRVLLPALLFAAICWLNCVAIDLWEAQGRRPFSSVGNTGHLEFGLLAIAVIGALLAFLPGLSIIFMSVLLSSILLLALYRNHRSLSIDSLRVLADVCLWTPVVFLLQVQSM